MDLLNELLRSTTDELVAELTSRRGFSQSAAEAFVPDAARAEFEVVKAEADDLDFGNLDSLAARVIGEIDRAKLAIDAGLDAEIAASGLETVIPRLFEAATERARPFGGLGTAVRWLRGGSSLAGVGGIASRLFGRR